MKKLIILSIALVAASVSFAQKDQGKTMSEKVAPPTIKFTCPMHPDVISDHAGKCPKCGMNLVAKSPEIVYTCPMHSNVVSKQPGKCPVCGMNLVAKKNKPAVVKYTCPMHADVISDKPGKCPKCGMDLKEKKN